MDKDLTLIERVLIRTKLNEAYLLPRPSEEMTFWSILRGDVTHTVAYAQGVEP